MKSVRVFPWTLDQAHSVSQFKKRLLLSHRNTCCICLDNYISRIFFLPSYSRILNEEILETKFPWNESNSPCPHQAHTSNLGLALGGTILLVKLLFLSLFTFWPVFPTILQQMCPLLWDREPGTPGKGNRGNQWKCNGSTRIRGDMERKTHSPHPSVLALTPPLPSLHNLLNLPLMNVPQDKCFYMSRNGFTALSASYRKLTHPLLLTAH